MKKQYPLAQFLFETRMPYAQGRIIYCVEQYVLPGNGPKLIDEALDIVSTLKGLEYPADDVGVPPDDPEVAQLSERTERYLGGRAMNAPEVYCIRAAATLHLWPAPALAVLSNIEKNLKAIKANCNAPDNSNS